MSCRVGVLILALCAISCDRKDDVALAPTYLRIQDVSLSAALGQGTDRHDFRDIWVYADSQFIGGYGIPTNKTSLAISSVKSNPSENFPLCTANKTAPFPLLTLLPNFFINLLFFNPL